MALSRSSSGKIFSSPIFAILCLFYIFTSTALAASAVLGVDLGTEYIKAALVKPGIPLEIVLTKDSRRKETSAVAFKPSKNPTTGLYPERVYGSDAVALAARFPGDVYPNLKPLLGLGADNDLVKEYGIRHPALQLEADKTRGTAAFRSGAFAADELPWAVEEILAMELQSIQKNAEALAGSKVKDLVLTIPTFYTTEEKRAVLLAADLAGLRVLELISDGLAVGLNYATSRTFPSVSEGGKPEYHMVFDMGAGSTKATVLKFQGRTVKDVGKFNKTIQEVKVLGSSWDRTLGGDSLNAVIVDDMIAKFVESPKAQEVLATAEKVQAHGRAAAKLWKEAERLRQILSANANTQAGFEGLYEDVDFKYKISRAEFEKLAEAHATRVGVVIQKALDLVNLEVDDLDSIILHGGAIRTPFVQKELEKIVGGSDKIRTNVNADEAAVFGAGFRGAGLSPSFRVKEIRTYDGASFAAGIKYIDIHKKNRHQRLYEPTTNLNAEKQFTFDNHEDFTIDFYQHVASSERVSAGSAEKQLKAITTTNLNESVALLKEKHKCENKDIRVKLSTRVSPVNGEMDIMKLVVDCEAEEVEKESMVDSVKGLFGFGKKDQAPLSEDGKESVDSSSTTESSTTSTSTTSSGSSSKSASASAKDKEAPKSKKNLIVIPLKYETELKGIPEVPASEITRMKDRIAAFDDSDRSRRLREEALNQLEGFTYKVRDFLDNEEFIAASTETERSELERKSKAASEWIYSGGADASRDELKAKLKEMKDIVTPIQKRREETAGRPEHVKALKEALEQTKSFIAGVKEQIKNETEAHSSFSASKSSASASPKTTSTITVDDFVDLEDDEIVGSASSTVTAPPEEETMNPPIYTEADVVAPQELYDNISKWLAELLEQQEKLAPTADPVLLIKDLTEKTKQLQDAGVELIMKSMKQPYKSSRKPTSKSDKPKKATKSKSKTKKSKKTGTATAEEANATIDLGFKGADGKAEKGAEGEGATRFKVGENDEMPTEEQILEAIKKSKENSEKGKKEDIKHGEL
ncbi:100af906-1dc9-42f0-bf98-804734147c91 [Sclerotinia trifoliorum]|uniref:100af906-1dc9-42f0-bf98-804734147c91 n=1 Tax=Sclerotinia trifoliorum TaxID=28548 RepID=A0A8H2ZSU3_9HELO|nr:100af906-1dc9-42f0-bf98-804734147c91 [Sclerotinia trifoliorum]